jgi:hypothetical protein
MTSPRFTLAVLHEKPMPGRLYVGEWQPRAGQALFRDHGCKIFDDIGSEYLRRRERSGSLGEIKAD